jgi:hypothetical protein
MNKIVNDLAEHADFYVGNEHYDKSHEERQRIFMEKFAELLVRECIDIAKKWEDQLESSELLEESNAVGIVAYRIARQFGVTE